MENKKPILCLDFDGVIHSYKSGWKGANIIPDEPVDGSFEAIQSYLNDFDVCVYSARSGQDGGIAAMKIWFVEHGWPENETGEPQHLQFPESKPPAFVSIDDRVLTFTGVFPEIETLKNFKPWNQLSV